MKNNPDVKKVLNNFSDSNIHTITELTDVNNDETFINSKIRKEK